ncbi:hypothetical protein DPMN_136496 [Dreissena polymorpha]|uniref:Uncharacterized protein n=1 Tax=Dreissena polymorpha TaxID=45954 RepID=A0A9D4JDU3_DREPO|nr:hypothetical protein DPMN_136496 [Dreissena polymorpha]
MTVVNLKLNNSLYEDVIDLKYRSMRDNHLFFEITEVVNTEQPSIGRSLNASDCTQEASGEPLDVSGYMPHAAMRSTTSDERKTAYQKSCNSVVTTYRFWIQKG